MNMPADRSLPNSATAICDALDAAGTAHVMAVGQPTPEIWDAVKLHMHKAAGRVSIYDCAWQARVYPPAAEGCAWILFDTQNYFTTYDQLYAIDAFTRIHGGAPLILVPQMLGGAARRDHYPASRKVPPAWRHIADPAYGKHGECERAVQVGGQRNGVLTAVEDVILERRDDGISLACAYFPAVDGLTMLFESDARWAGAMAKALTRYQSAEALASMKASKLIQYLLNFSELAWPKGTQK